MSDRTNPSSGAVKPRSPGSTKSPAGYLAQDYQTWHALLASQSLIVQRFFDVQASKLAEALVQNTSQIRFSLPDRVVVEPPREGENTGTTLSVPTDMREQMSGGLLDRMTRTDSAAALRQRLAELEASSNRAVAISAGLIRHSTARFMVYSMLPSGRTVTYKAGEGEEIPSIPVGDELQPASAITATTDAIVEGESGASEEGRGELLVPYVPAARRFFLPQWVAFDENDRLLVNSIREADAHIASMQRYLGVLHASVGLAPYMVADEIYQQKRYGILGQLVNQGRALARYQTQEIIKTIRHRASSQDLNRGLSLSLPYFDDQALRLKTHDFEVIPGGRIMFVPAFVVRAARQEQVKVAQDTRLDPATRKHLLAELQTLEKAFE